jgi:hypothetical protein
MIVSVEQINVSSKIVPDSQGMQKPWEGIYNRLKIN